MRCRPLLASTLVVLLAAARTADAQTNPLIDLANGPVQASDPLLIASVDRISRGSPTWRKAIDEVEQTGRSVLVVTPQELQAGGHGAFDTHGLAEVVPVLNPGLEVRLVLVVVDLRLLHRVHEERRSVPRDVDADLDRIIVHEIYGHAIPYLLAGNLSGRCPDPKRGERASEACSIRRENVVRAELGLGYRRDSGVSSLTFALASQF